MSLIHCIHMERPDPRAFQMKQLWRGWVETPTRGQGIVVTEEMQEGGRFQRIEIGTQTMIDPDPVVHLQHVIEAKREQGWADVLVSHEAVYVDEQPPQLHAFSFSADKEDQREIVREIDRLTQTLPSIAGWADPRAISELRASAPSRWDGTLQVGSYRFDVRMSARRGALISARVRPGSLADQFLTVLAAGRIPGLRAEVVSDGSTVTGLNAKVLLKALPRSEWLNELAVAVGASVPALKGVSATQVRGITLEPVIF